MQYWYTARFLRSLKKLDSAVQDDVVNAISLFERGNKNEVVKLHKLHGKFAAYHAFSANFSYRILVKIKKQHVYYLDVGTHALYL